MPTNPEMGEFEINIGGSLRPFRFSILEAYKVDRVHLKTGEKTILNLNEENINVPLLVDIMHVGLAAHDPSIKLETVAAWLTKDAHRIAEFFAFIGSALAKLFGRGVQTEGKENPGPLAEPRGPAATSINLSGDSEHGQVAAAV